MFQNHLSTWSLRENNLEAIPLNVIIVLCYKTAFEWKAETSYRPKGILLYCPERNNQRGESD